MRAIGVSFKPQPPVKTETGGHQWICAVGNVAIVDVESGQALDGISNVKAEYSIDGAIKLTVEIFPNAVVEWKGDFYK